MAQVYVPDTLEFDVSGILGTIGTGIVSAGKSLLTNVFTQANISTVVSGVVAKQVAKYAAPKPYAPAAPTTIYGQPAPAPMYAPPVSSQPIIISGGGGGMPQVQAAPQPGVLTSFLGDVPPVYLIAGAVAFALLLSRR